MWLGEQITERGVGNGISMLILASIIASAPGMISQAFSQNLNLIVMLLFVVLGITVIAAIVFY